MWVKVAEIVEDMVAVMGIVIKTSKPDNNNGDKIALYLWCWKIPNLMKTKLGNRRLE